MKAEIRVRLKSGKLIKFTLPSKYQSDQWLGEICETLEDAEEVQSVSFTEGDGS